MAELQSLQSVVRGRRGSRFVFYRVMTVGADYLELVPHDDEDATVLIPCAKIARVTMKKSDEPDGNQSDD